MMTSWDLCVWIYIAVTSNFLSVELVSLYGVKERSSFIKMATPPSFVKEQLKLLPINNFELIDVAVTPRSVTTNTSGLSSSHTRVSSDDLPLVDAETTVSVGTG